MVVQVHLHTVVQYKTPQGRVRWLKLRLPEGATVSDVLQQIKFPLVPDVLVLVINHRVVDETARLFEGDRLDIIPSVSGG